MKLIIGMAVKGYCYDPKAERSDKISDIVHDLDSAGVSLDKIPFGNGFEKPLPPCCHVKAQTTWIGKPNSFSSLTEFGLGLAEFVLVICRAVQDCSVPCWTEAIDVDYYFPSRFRLCPALIDHWAKGSDPGR